VGYWCLNGLRDRAFGGRIQSSIETSCRLYAPDRGPGGPEARRGLSEKASSRSFCADESVRAFLADGLGFFLGEVCLLLA
jgi:hypothetical protein